MTPINLGIAGSKVKLVKTEESKYCLLDILWILNLHDTLQKYTGTPLHSTWPTLVQVIRSDWVLFIQISQSHISIDTQLVICRAIWWRLSFNIVGAPDKKIIHIFLCHCRNSKIKINLFQYCYIEGTYWLMTISTNT
jgi:hypothetical protein